MSDRSLFQSPIERVWFSHSDFPKSMIETEVFVGFNPLLSGSGFRTPSVFGTFPEIESPISGGYSSFHCRIHLYNIGRFDHI